MWSWLLEGIGILGAVLVGRKFWWAWTILLGNTFIWGIYAVITSQYGFLMASFFYAPVYVRNAVHWKKGNH